MTNTLPGRRFGWRLAKPAAILAMAAAALLAMPPFAAAQQIDAPQLDLPRERLSIGVHQIEVQIASRPPQRQIGLMQRRELPGSEGMLFVFDEAAVQCFWMKNTLVPLTAAFVADDGTIVNFEDMQPQTTESHCSAKPVRYVLEMNQGWFDARRIKPGFRLSGARFDSSKPAPKK